MTQAHESARDAPCSDSSHHGKTTPSYNPPKRPSPPPDSSTRPASPRAVPRPDASRTLHAIVVEPCASQSPRRASGPCTWCRGGRRSRGNYRKRGCQWPHSRNAARCLPLTILDSAQKHRIPKRVHLAAPRVHQIRQVLVDLLGSKCRMIVAQGLCTLADSAGREKKRGRNANQPVWRHAKGGKWTCIMLSSCLCRYWKSLISPPTARHVLEDFVDSRGTRR